MNSKSKDAVICIPGDVLRPMDSLEAALASNPGDRQHQTYHDHQEAGCARVDLDIEELVILFDHHYEIHLEEQWMFFMYGSVSSDGMYAEARVTAILDIISKCDPPCFYSETREEFVKRIVVDAQNKFFKGKNPFWVKVFKGEATFDEEVEAYRQKMEKNEQIRAQSERHGAAYSAVVTDRFARHGRFVKDGDRVVFEHKDGRVIEVTEYAMQESHSVSSRLNPTPEQEQEERALREKQHAIYEAHKGSAFEALMVEVLGDGASTIGALKAIAGLAAAAVPKDSPPSRWANRSGVWY